MSDASPPGPGLWTGISNLLDVVKIAFAPFAAMGVGGLATLAWKFWHGSATLAERRKRDEASERDKVKGSLDARQTAYMDRMERTEERLIAENKREREEAERVKEALEEERDVVWATALDQEQERHDDRHAHISTCQKFNSLLDRFRRLHAGTLSPEGIAEVLALTPIEDPPRVPDVRSRVRVASRAVRK